MCCRNASGNTGRELEETNDEDDAVIAVRT